MNFAPYIAICPGCSVRLQMNEAQMEVADGRVRCAVCSTVFYAPDQLLRGVYVPHQTEQNNTDNLLFFPSDNPPVIEQQGVSHVVDTSLPIEEREASLEYSSDKQNNLTYASEHSHQKSDDYQSDSEQVNYVSEGLSRNVFDQATHRTSTKLQEYRKHSRPVFAFVGTPSSTLSRSLWWLASVTLAVFLVSVIFASKFHDWQKRPMLRGLYAQLCILLDCELERNILPIAMQISPAGQKEIASGIYSVQGLLENNAYYSQPLPIIRLDFIDLQGNSFAQRDFIPSEYTYGEKLTLYPKEQMNFNVQVELNERVDYRLIPSLSLVSYY